MHLDEKKTENRLNSDFQNRHVSNVEIQLLKVDEIKLLNRRLRTRKTKVFDKLCKSVKRFGIVKPILIDDHCNVVDGLGILDAAMELGITEVPTIMIDQLSPAEIKALRISLNKLQELGEWDQDVLRNEFETIVELGSEFDLNITGFEMGEIDLLLDSDANEKEEETNGDDLIPYVTGEAVSKVGDQFKLGRHVLRCGDALSQKDI